MEFAPFWRLRSRALPGSLRGQKSGAERGAAHPKGRSEAEEAKRLARPRRSAKTRNNSEPERPVTTQNLRGSMKTRTESRACGSHNEQSDQKGGPIIAGKKKARQPDRLHGLC
jgi:hypothetical protein